ncbi:hypothetical protein [Pseudoxanthomonas beigongshangi]
MGKKAGKDVGAGASLPVEVGEGETLGQKSARLAVDGVAGNAFVALMFGAPGGMLSPDDLGDVHNELKRTVERTKAGGTDLADTMLTAQAASLNQVYVEMARRAMLNMGEYPKAAETYMRLALKAQSQCRSTLESLAEIRNPRPVAFVKQANIANGPQQVNNNEAVYQAECETPRADMKTKQNKLLENNGNVTRLDTRTQSAPGRSDTTLEAVEAINRADNGGR